MQSNLSIGLIGLLFLISCSPRDVLSRRLATDLIAASGDFTRPQQFILRTGLLSNQDYLSSDSLILQHHGWISVNTVPCSQGVAPPPCWEVLLTPSGVDTIRALVPSSEAGNSALPIPAAKRELIAVTGIGKQGTSADIEFLWRWTPLNEIGQALYSADLRYKSTVGFRKFDDGWRVVERSPRPGQNLADALKNAEPAP